MNVKFKYEINNEIFVIRNLLKDLGAVFDSFRQHSSPKVAEDLEAYGFTIRKYQ